jgi:L-threonylcarbamoyladenylate synthase
MIVTHCFDTIAALIKQGGLVAYPTEAVWGLGCDPFNEEAVNRLLEIKGRPAEKGLILIAGHANQLTPWQAGLEHDAFIRLTTPTAYPTSWVVPDESITPIWIRGQHKSVAIRLSQHAPVQSLCNAFGAVIVSTSANPSGQAAARSINQVQDYFAGKLDGILHAPLGHAQSPSQVIDLISNACYRS